MMMSWMLDGILKQPTKVRKVAAKVTKPVLTSIETAIRGFKGRLFIGVLIKNDVAYMEATKSHVRDLLKDVPADSLTYKVTGDRIYIDAA
jgi:hypothetical protein